MSADLATTPDVLAILQDAVRAADDTQAIELRALDLKEVSDFTEFFVICSGRSQRQVGAIADSIKRRLAKAGAKPLHVEGTGQAPWVLLDYGSVVIHVFDPETREYYGLERLWSDAPDVTGALR